MRCRRLSKHTPESVWRQGERDRVRRAEKDMGYDDDDFEATEPDPDDLRDMWLDREMDEY